MTQPVLHQYDLGPGVRAFSTTRHGGVGKGDYASFNINPYCGDNEDDVEANRASLCQMLGLDVCDLVFPHQVHGDVVAAIDSQWMKSLSPIEKRNSLDGVDAVMTNLGGVCIGVSTADCVPILLYDAARHAACAVHAGWRGTVKRIVQKAVEAMASHYGTEPQQLRAVIGPSISLQAFEVGDEVYREFEAAHFDMARIARRCRKWHIDLWECNRRQLVDAGVLASSIQTAGICTYERHADFFSARRMGLHSGRIFTGVVME